MHFRLDSYESPLNYHTLEIHLFKRKLKRKTFTFSHSRIKEMVLTQPCNKYKIDRETSSLLCLLLASVWFSRRVMCDFFSCALNSDHFLSLSLKNYKKYNTQPEFEDSQDMLWLDNVKVSWTSNLFLQNHLEINTWKLNLKKGVSIDVKGKSVG